ncbi:MAG: RNA polymerase sigma factor [Cyclobacteriaceae bacterium]
MLFTRPLPELTDQDLVAMYRLKGDMAVLGELYKRYSGLVYGVCLKYLKNKEDARDAVMQIYEKLTVNLLNHEVTYFKSWLYATSRNYCLMQLRAQKGKHVEELSPFVMESGDFPHLESGSDLEENLVKLEKCIEKLAAEQQQCIRLFFLMKRCYAEISTETGYALNQVKSYIQNGKRNLKICMERND